MNDEELNVITIDDDGVDPGRKKTKGLFLLSSAIKVS